MNWTFVTWCRFSVEVVFSVFGEFAAPREPLPLFGVSWGDWAQLSHWFGRPTRTRLRRATCTLDGDDEVRVYVYAGRLPRAWEWT